MDEISSPVATLLLFDVGLTGYRVLSFQGTDRLFLTLALHVFQVLKAVAREICSIFCRADPTPSKRGRRYYQAKKIFQVKPALSWHCVVCYDSSGQGFCVPLESFRLVQLISPSKKLHHRIDD